jgi:hypothetical protein
LFSAVQGIRTRKSLCMAQVLKYFQSMVDGVLGCRALEG